MRTRTPRRTTHSSTPPPPNKCDTTHTEPHKPHRFDFDDSCILPLADEAVVTTPAQGKDSAYLLMYRSVALNAAAGVTGAAGGARVLPPAPPEVWEKAVKVRIFVFLFVVCGA